MAIFTAQELLTKHGVTPDQVKPVIQNQTPPPQDVAPSRFAIPSLQSVGDAGLNVAKGFAKGVGGSLNALADMPGPVNTAVELASGSLFDQKNKGARFSEEQLKSQNTEQSVGKVLEFATELLFPTKGSALVTKGERVVGASLDNLGSRISSIGDDVADNGVKVKDKLIDLVTNIDDKTKTALNRTTLEEFDSIAEQARKAMLDDRNRTPLEAVGDSIISGLEQIKSRANSVGEAKSALMNQAKIGYTKVGNIAQRAALQVQKAFSKVKLDPADSKAVQTFQQTLMKLGDNPSLKEVDATIDLLQDQLYKASRSNAVEITDRVTGPLRRELGALNEQVKALGGKSYAKLNQEYSDLIGLVTEVNARLGKEGASAGSFVKRLFSPSDARTKQLFEQLQKYTGQDYFKDARISKFVMEALDDPRAKSLLEEIPTPSGIINSAYKAGMKSFEVPLKAARNLIERNRPKELPLGSGKNLAGAFTGAQTNENGDVSFDPVSAVIGMAGIKMGAGKKEALKELINYKKANLYLIRQSITQLGEKVNKNMVKTLEKELRSLEDEFRKLRP